MVKSGSANNGAAQNGDAARRPVFEYKVVPAPRKAKAIKGVRSHEDQFAGVIAEVMDEMALQNWEYVRAESLPCDEKAGLTRKIETYQTVLVFRRAFATQQVFFDTLPQKQIEHQKIIEDTGQQDIIFASGRRAATAAPRQPEAVKPPQEPGFTSVLEMLRQRRARHELDNPQSYDPHLKLAAE